MMISVLVTLLAGCNPSDTATPSATTMTPTTTVSTTLAPTATAATSTTGTSPTTMTTSAPMTANYIDLSPMEAKALIDNTPGIIIIDVSPKYAEGHLPGAINYYAGDGSLDKAIPVLDKTKTYLVYCHVDSVSILGAQKLIDAGFTSVYRLAGNYAAWVAAGYAIEK